MGFDPCIRPLKIWESIGTPIPTMGVHLGVWMFIPSHSFALPGTWDVIPRLPSWRATLQALALVASPRLGLQDHKYSKILEPKKNDGEIVSQPFDNSLHKNEVRNHLVATRWIFALEKIDNFFGGH